MADHARFNYDKRSSHLGVFCPHESFAKVRDAVIATAAIGDTLGTPIPRIETIEITNATEEPRSTLARDRVGLIGCAVVCSALIFVFAIGVGTIISWLW